MHGPMVAGCVGEGCRRELVVTAATSAEASYWCRDCLEKPRRWIEAVRGITAGLILGIAAMSLCAVLVEAVTP